ncbi:MAG: hypothetical protein GF329_11295 [Candidatus Lokiarchaeota archaeon]|nr:hypothetical protein [Candidatus Lokiarchaeota archaeon]
MLNKDNKKESEQIKPENIHIYRFKKNFSQFIKAVKNTDLENINHYLLLLIKNTINKEYSKQSSRKVTEFKKCYNEIYRSKDNKEFITPSEFSFLYDNSSNKLFRISTIKTWRDVIIKFFKSFGMLRLIDSVDKENEKESKPSFSYNDKEKVQITQHKPINDRIFYNKVEELIKKDSKYIKEPELLDNILAALIEVKYGSTNASKLSFYREKIKREINEINWITRLKLALLDPELKEYPILYLETFKKIGKKEINKESDSNPEYIKTLKLFWNKIKKRFYPNKLEEKSLIEEEIKNQEEKVKININQDKANSPEDQKNLDYLLNYANKLWEIADFNLENQNNTEYFRNAFMAIQNLLDIILIKNEIGNLNLKEVRKIFEILTKKGYKLISEEKLIQLKNIYYELIDKGKAITNNNLNSHRISLTNLYELLLKQINEPINYPNVKKHQKQKNENVAIIEEPNTPLLVNEIENTAINYNLPQTGENYGVILAKFDNNKGKIPLYYISKNRIDKKHIKEMAILGLSIDDANSMFNYTKTISNNKKFRSFVKRFHIESNNARGFKEIYALIFFTNSDLVLHEDVLDYMINKLKEDFSNYKKIISNGYSSIRPEKEESISPNKKNLQEDEEIVSLHDFDILESIEDTKIEEKSRTSDKIFIVFRVYKAEIINKKYLDFYLYLCKKYEMKPLYYDCDLYHHCVDYHDLPQIRMFYNENIKIIEMEGLTLEQIESNFKKQMSILIKEKNRIKNNNENISEIQNNNIIKNTCEKKIESENENKKNDLYIQKVLENYERISRKVKIYDKTYLESNNLEKYIVFIPKLNENNSFCINDKCLLVLLNDICIKLSIPLFWLPYSQYTDSSIYKSGYNTPLMVLSTNREMKYLNVNKATLNLKTIKKNFKRGKGSQSNNGPLTLGNIDRNSKNYRDTENLDLSKKLKYIPKGHQKVIRLVQKKTEMIKAIKKLKNASCFLIYCEKEKITQIKHRVDSIDLKLPLIAREFSSNWIFFLNIKEILQEDIDLVLEKKDRIKFTNLDDLVQKIKQLNDNLKRD